MQTRSKLARSPPSVSSVFYDPLYILSSLYHFIQQGPPQLLHCQIRRFSCTPPTFQPSTHHSPGGIVGSRSKTLKVPHNRVIIHLAGNKQANKWCNLICLLCFNPKGVDQGTQQRNMIKFMRLQGVKIRWFLTFEAKKRIKTIKSLSGRTKKGTEC